MPQNKFWKKFFEEYIKGKTFLGFTLAFFNAFSSIISILWVKGIWIPLIGIVLSILTLIKFSKKIFLKLGPLLH